MNDVETANNNEPVLRFCTFCFRAFATFD